MWWQVCNLPLDFGKLQTCRHRKTLLQPLQTALGDDAAGKIQPAPGGRRGLVLPDGERQAEGDLRLVDLALLQSEQSPKHVDVGLPLQVQAEAGDVVLKLDPPPV